MAKRAYIGIPNFEKRALPAGYMQIERVHSSGLSYVDTGFSPTAKTRVEAKFQINSTTGWLFGCRDTASSTAPKQFGAYVASGTVIRSDYFGTTQNGTVSTTQGIAVVDKDANVLSFNGTVVTNTAVSSGECTRPLWIFNLNNVGSPGTYLDGSLYYFKIYDDGVLVRDYVPCNNPTGLAGLYDMVNGEFVSSANNYQLTSGADYESFARKIKKGYIGGIDGVAHKIKKAYIGIGGGATYREVEYIESSGTQYIDTGFAHNQNTRVVMDAQLTNVPTGNVWLFEGRKNTNATGACSKGIFFYATSTGKWTTDFEGSGTSRLDFDNVAAVDRLHIDYDKNVCTINGQTVTHPTATFQSTYNLYLLADNRGGTIRSPASAKVYSCQIYDNGNLIRDFVPVINSNGTAGLFDKVSKQFYANKGSGNFTAGAETGKTYVSNGVARPCWAGGKLVYYGTATALSAGRHEPMGATVGDYALVAGGTQSLGGYTVIDVYDGGLTRSTAGTPLSSGRGAGAATTVGGYAIFAGGRKFKDTYSGLAVVDAFNVSLTRTTPTALPDKVWDNAAATVGDRGLFIGGRKSNSTTDYVSSVTAYSSSLVRSVLTSLPSTVYGHKGVTFGNYALFAGGFSDAGGVFTTVYAYNASLTRSTPTALSTGRALLASAIVGGYALFAGGCSSGFAPLTAVNAYDASLTRTSPSALSTKRNYLAGAMVGDFALFAGGLTENLSSAHTTVVDAYDTSLARTKPTALSTSRYTLAGIATKDYAIFAGGNSSNVVDVYTVV